MKGTMMLTQTKKTYKGSLKFTLFMLAGVLLLILATAASISFGAADMSLSLAWGAVFHFDPDVTEHHIIQTFRLPRTIADILVGCSLADYAGDYAQSAS